MSSGRRITTAAVTVIFILAASAIMTVARAGIVEKKDVLTGMAGDYKILGDMYLPEGDGPFPAIYSIHGGGFVVGDKSQEPLVRYCRELAEAGFVVLNINYRLLNQGGIFPNSIHDVKCGLAWLKTHAAEYGVDPDRIAVSGYSAGAHLAAMVSLTQNVKEFQPVCSGLEDVDTSVAAGVLLYPPTNLMTLKGGPAVMLQGEFARFAKINTPKKKKAFMRKFSPVNYVDKNAPPLFICHSDPDQLVNTGQSRELAAELERKNLPYGYFEIYGEEYDHGFYLQKRDLPQTEEAHRRILAFLKGRLVK
ncbi:MAG TPA: alpha/beta hydrolase [bacterium]|nr:alpha/beta hydrolase [bacterium]